MNALPPANETPVIEVFFRCVPQPEIPVDGHANFTAIDQANVKFTIGKPNTGSEDRRWFFSQSAHARFRQQPLIDQDFANDLSKKYKVFDTLLTLDRYQGQSFLHH
jgi:hypothetical protein